MTRVAMVSAKPYDIETFSSLVREKPAGIEVVPVIPRLTPETVSLVAGFPVICPFVHDVVSAAVLEATVATGTRMIALRCAGFNTVDLEAARALGVRVVRVPAYSPASVAEHTVGLMLALNRKLHRAYNRVREGNFELTGLLGFEMQGCTVGVVGTGKIGLTTARVLSGFGVRLLGYDPYPNPEAEALGLTYVSLDDLVAQSDIVTLHCPLTPDTHHLIGPEQIALMKPGTMLINTGRGALLDAQAAIEGLKSQQIGALGLDVYEQEDSLFFHDRSNDVLQDDIFSRFLTFPNVIVTGHQAFFTRDALTEIAATTLDSVARFMRDDEIPPERLVI